MANIQNLDTDLTDYFSSQLVIDENLTRKIVSFQANKDQLYYRWYKYKEAFSVKLVEYLISKYQIEKGEVFDPFAGAGTTLFACSNLGYNVEGIELLPVGQKIIEANIIARNKEKKIIIKRLNHWISKKIWTESGNTKDFEVLRITKGHIQKIQN